MKKILGFLLAGLVLLVILLRPLFAEDNNLSWIAPTQNEDGSPLTDLAGYRVYHSLNLVGGPYSQIADVSDPFQQAYLHADQGQGLHCYVVTAYDEQGNESAFSNEACKFVDTLAPGAPSGLTVN